MSMSKSPLMLGIETGSFLRKLFTANNAGMIIAHRIKGRRRYTCRAIKGETQLCADIEKMLSSFKEITSVTVNPITCSITVTYAANEAFIDSLFDTLSHQIAGSHALQEQSLIPPALIAVSNNLNDSARRLRDEVRGFFNHAEPMFLSRIAGLAMLCYGVSRVVFGGERPSGTTMFWWGLGLLLRQTHKHYAVKPKQAAAEINLAAADFQKSRASGMNPPAKTREETLLKEDAVQIRNQSAPPKSQAHQTAAPAAKIVPAAANDEF